MYENGNMDYLTCFLQAGSINDFLNQADYASELRPMTGGLTEFRETKDRGHRGLTQQEKEELETLQAQGDGKAAGGKTDWCSPPERRSTNTRMRSPRRRSWVDQYGKLESQQNAGFPSLPRGQEGRGRGREEEKPQRQPAKTAMYNFTTSTGTTNNGAASNAGQ